MDTKDPTPQVGYEAAAADTPFPSDDELIRGKQFFGGEFREDVRQFCNQLGSTFAEQNIPLPPEVIPVLRRLEEKPDWTGLHALARHLDDIALLGDTSVRSCRRRCQYYLAAAGNPDAAGFIAQEAAILALEDTKSSGDMHMIPIALSWSVTAHFIAGLSESALLETSVSSVEHLRRNVLRTFEKSMMCQALVSVPRNEEALAATSPPVSDLSDFPRSESERPIGSNIVSFPRRPEPNQRRITLTVAELVDILKASNKAPETLGAALAAVGIPTDPPPTRPYGDD